MWPEPLAAGSLVLRRMDPLAGRIQRAGDLLVLWADLAISRVKITAAIASSQNFHKIRTAPAPAMKPNETTQRLG